MEKENIPEIKMVLPFNCPHCKMATVLNLNIPSPEVTSVLKQADISDDIKKLIDDNENHDTTKAD